MIAFLAALPFYYLFKSRLKSTFEKFSWFIIYPIPVFYLIITPNVDYAFEISLLFVLSLAAFYSVYEIGYLENDLRTTLTESEPTFRVPEDERSLLSKNYKSINSIKYLLVFVCLAMIHFFSDHFDVEVYLFQFIACLFLVRVLFFIHNTIRNRFNVLTYTALSATKYCSPILLFIEWRSAATVFVVSFFMFPLIRTLESASKEKYGFSTLQKLLGGHDTFRVKYYLLCSLVVVALSFIDFHYAYLVFIYFLFARSAGLLLIKFKANEVEEFRKYKNIADKPSRHAGQEGNENR